MDNLLKTYIKHCEQEGEIQNYSLLVWNWDLVASLVLILPTSLRKANLFRYKLKNSKSQKFIIFNLTSVWHEKYTKWPLAITNLYQIHFSYCLLSSEEKLKRKNGIFFKISKNFVNFYGFNCIEYTKNLKYKSRQWTYQPLN